MAEIRLKRELRMWEAVAISIGIMAPTSASALNGILPAAQAGRAVPLVFLIGFVGVGLIAYSFARLTRYFQHAGSVYVLAGKTLGSRAGFFAAFGLLGTYVVFAVSAFAATGLFATTFLSTTGIAKNAPWLPISFGAMILILWLASIRLRPTTRTLLIFEGIGVALILILVGVIFAKIGSHTAPQGQSFDWHVFAPAAGFGPVFAASVYAFLSWAGFEGAATLGEETSNPLRNIPRAIIYSVAGIGVFYVLVMIAETLGFGTSSSGIKNFASSSAPFSTLSTAYIGTPMADALNFATTISQFACALACSAGAARILFALARDGFGPKRLGRAATRTGTPLTAFVVILACCAAFLVGQYLAGTTAAVNVYYYYATLGVLALLIVYAVTGIGALRFLFFAGRRKAPIWEAALPILGVAYLGYVFYKQIIPVPASPYNLFPYIAAAWLLLGAAIVIFWRALAQRVGDGLTRVEAEEATEVALDPAAGAAAHDGG